MIVMGSVIGLAFFLLVLLVSLVVIPFGVAGTFIIVADALVYGLATGFEKITLMFVGVLLGLALLVELIEAVLGSILARQFGGSRYAVAGTIIGGFLGALAGTPVVPFVGTVIGGFLGCFLGAALFEWIHHKNMHRALQVGYGAFLGALGGKVTKFTVAVVMVVLICVRIF